MEQHRNSIRLHDYDYSSAGAYFVTMVTKDRSHIFGDIVDGKLHLSKIGKIARLEWERLPFHFPKIKTGEFVLMPDHIHCIIHIVESQVRTTHQNLPEITNGEDIGQLMIAPNNDGSPQRGSASQVRTTHQNLPEITNGEDIGQLMIAPNNDGSPQRGSAGQVRATHQNLPGITNGEDIGQLVIAPNNDGSPNRIGKPDDRTK